MMLYVGKILPTVLLPAGGVILLLILAIALRRRAMTVGALALLWLSSTSPVGDALMRAVEGGTVRQPAASAPNADAVVVLSGMLRPGGGPAAEDEWSESVDRFEAGVELAKAGKAPLLVFTGGWVPWNPAARPEGEVLRERAMARGIPGGGIVVTGKVRNTEEEARAVAGLLRGRPGVAGRSPAVILVTSAFHMRRSAMLFTRAGLTVTPFPVDFQTSSAPLSFLNLLPNAGSMRNTEIALRECYGYLYYRLIKTG